MCTLHAVFNTEPGLNLIRPDILPIGWRQNLVILAHLLRLGDANGRPPQLLGVVILRLWLDNSHFRVLFIVTKHLAASMIVGTEFPDRHGHAIHCIEGNVETTRGTVPILARNKATVDAVKDEADKPLQRSDKPTDPTKEDST